MTSFLEFSLSVSNREPCILNGFDFYWQIPRLAAWQFKFLLCFCFLSTVVSHLQVWHHMHKNIVNFSYLYLCTHMSVLSLCDNTLPVASAVEENWLGMPDLSWFYSATGKGRGRELEWEWGMTYELLVSWPLKENKGGTIHLDIFQLLGMLFATLIL